MAGTSISVVLSDEFSTSINKRGGTEDVIPVIHIDNIWRVEDGEEDVITISFHDMAQLKKFIDVWSNWLKEPY